MSWRLASGGSLALELSGRDLSNARVVVSGPSGRIAVPFITGGDLATARFVVVSLPAGTYDRLAIEMEPVPGLTSVDATGLTVLRGGRLDLRGYRLLPNSGTSK